MKTKNISFLAKICKCYKKDKSLTSNLDDEKDFLEAPMSVTPQVVNISTFTSISLSIRILISIANGTQYKQIHPTKF